MRITASFRHGFLVVMAGIAVSGSLCGMLDSAGWRAYEAVEEAWLRERHGMLVQQAPAALNAARLDLDIGLAVLQRRALEFRHLQKCDPAIVVNAVWQLSAIELSSDEMTHLASLPEYRKLDERIRQLESALQRHPQHGILRRAQTRLWKTPQYRDAHRRYTGRIQDVQAQHGSQSAPSASTVN